jgi:hypothetical protein
MVESVLLPLLHGWRERPAAAFIQTGLIGDDAELAKTLDELLAISSLLQELEYALKLQRKRLHQLTLQFA